MLLVETKEIQKSDILHCEATINNLWKELNTANIPYSMRMEVEQMLSRCEEQFHDALGGQASFSQVTENLTHVDKTLAISSIQQAENEISKAAHNGAAFQGLENVSKELNEGNLTPGKARHEVKEIMRHHT